MLRLRYAVHGEARSVLLSGDRLRIGRGSDNDLVLPDVSVSRNHAELRSGPEGWLVRDLKSTNGVEVNGVAVETAVLRSGDALKVGVFDLAVEAEDLPTIPLPHRTVKPEGTGSLTGFGNATIIRPLADFNALYGLEGGLEGGAPKKKGTEVAVPEADYAGRMIGLLTRLARTLIVAESVDAVLDRMLELSFEAFQVDRGFILLSNEEGELVCELTRVKDQVERRPQGPIPVSRTMLHAVMNERVALVTYDAQSDQRLSGGESIRLHQIRSAMCAPLWSGDRIIGVIQVDSPFQVGAFGERDLDVLTTLANYAAVAVERIRYARQVDFERQVRSRLERYHSPAVIEEVMRRGGEEGARPLQLAHASVLFADLVGFTAFAENYPPETVAASLDAFLSLSVEAIFRAGGTLDKFIGDCVMAFFGAPVAQADHAERAVRAAIEIQQGLNAWAAEQEAQGQRGFQARVGLNSGPVVVGDIGSVRRVDYTVLGNTVNVAARLESFAAQPGEVVIGAETHRLLNGAYRTEELGDLKLKGLQQQITAYRVVL